MGRYYNIHLNVTNLNDKKFCLYVFTKYVQLVFLPLFVFLRFHVHMSAAVIRNDDKQEIVFTNEAVRAA